MPKLKKKSVEDYFLIEVPGSIDPLTTKHYMLLTPEQYESDIKKAFEAGCILTFQEDLCTLKLPSQTGMDDLYEEWRKRQKNENL